MINRDPVITLQPTQIASIDSIDYVGNLVYVNGVLDKYLFSGGYAQAHNPTGAKEFTFDFTEEESEPEDPQEPTGSGDGNQNETAFSFHYYTQDHLGNNRAVVNENGTLRKIGDGSQ